MLDGVRAISILWVILHHLPIPLPGWLEFIRIRGDLGVELFFAVSGFLVTRSLQQCLARASYKDVKSVVIDFLIRRTSRVFPAYYVTLIGLGIIAFVFDQSLLMKLESINDILFSFPLYLYNYFKFSTDGHIPGTFNIMWSLAFEEQFYLILITTFVFFRKNFAAALIVLGASSITWRITQSFFLTDSIVTNQIQLQSHLRLDSIIWGCLAWIFYEKIVALWNRYRTHNKILGTFIIIFFIGTSCLHHMKHTPQWMASVYILTAISYTLFVVYLTLTPTQIISRIFSGKILIKIGIISYEIYLIHEIVVGIAVRLGLKSSPIIFIAVSMLASIATALAFHHIFAKPVQKKIRKLFK